MGSNTAHASTVDRAYGLGIVVLLALAVVVRLFFYSGFYGSDEVTYVDSALKITQGDLTPSSYIGAIRYGLQLPMAGFTALFGATEFAANLWPFLCSLGEVLVIAALGRHLVGKRTALLAGLLLALLPLHVHYAGRIMADAPLAFFITSSFLLFWVGQQQNRTSAFLWAGIAAGCSFWVKEVAVVYLAVFFSFPFLFRCWNPKWFWMLFGFALVVGCNLLFFFALTGNPFYVFKVVSTGVADYASSSGRFAGTATETGVSFYPEYLFAKVYHTWLLGPLAVAGLFALWRRRNGDASAAGFITLWALGLVALLSLLPVSLKPVTLISKQVNYMLMFIAPLTLLAASLLARLQGKALGLALAAFILPALLLGALERNTVAVFTANGKGTVELARTLGGSDQLYGSLNAERAAYFDSLLHRNKPPVKVQPLSDLVDGHLPPAADKGLVVVVDPSDDSRSVLKSGTVPPCWQALGTLKPVVETRLDGLFRAMAQAAGLLPGSLGGKVAGKLTELVEPTPARIYRIPDASQVHCPAS